MDADERRSAAEGLRERFRQAGVPLTLQRRAVLEVLEGRPDHPTADDVHAAVAGRLGGVSRTTIYRSLETLVRLGLVQRIAHPGSAVRYDPRLDRHHHLICDRCGAVADLPAEHLPGLDLPVAELRARGFRPRDVAVQISGLCRDCAAAE